MTLKSIWAVLSAPTILFGCSATLAPVAFSGGTPEMRPEVFFAGRTSSFGLLENSSGAPTRRLHVTGSGQLNPDGSFQLVQSIIFDNETPTLRTWVLRRLDEHHFTGTLTDAAGPVEGETYGELFHLRYPTRTPWGGQMEQWMYLQPDGRTLLNEATISLLGMTVARVSELITHEDH